MKLIAYDVQVGNTPTLVFSFVPAALHSIMFKAIASLELGEGSVSIGKGFNLSAGEAIGFTHEDFDITDPETTEPVSIYAVASAPTEMRVFGFLR